ncbi:Pro-kumamolisin, activation domain-containing protein [Rhexocercosporidium sp. MPI-PUGE-AT-0058]|nr:Pro-kumamolisin, activation domain-containing protein [Rhexocercosporidium sp. MPI-PUGE-AT-0058]
MKISHLALIGGVVTISVAYLVLVPLIHVVHERREAQLDKWSKRDVKLNRDAIILLSIGLTQRNIVETITAIKEWLVESGISYERIQFSKDLTWLKVNITVEEAESLLKTEYSIYTNANTSKDYLGCETYNIPASIRYHINLITLTIQFDATVRRKKQRRDLQDRSLKPNLIPQARSVPYAATLPLEYQLGLRCERDLDLEYAIVLVYPQKVILYQTGDII